MRKLYLFKKRVFKFLSFPLKSKLNLFEAFLLLGLTRILILVLPFRKIAALIGTQTDVEALNLSEDTRLKVEEISKSIELMCRYTPWQSKCLVQAISAQYMLKRRRITSTLYLGVAKELNEKRLIAHAWLRCGEIIVTGDKGRERFSMVTQFTSIVRR